jgi:hypothetical protein
MLLKSTLFCTFVAYDYLILISCSLLRNGTRNFPWAARIASKGTTAVTVSQLLNRSGQSPSWETDDLSTKKLFTSV